MRVMVTSSPGWGHVHPMVPLVRALLDRGDEVVWAASPEVCTALEREGISVAAAGLGQAESQRLFWERFPECRALTPEQRPAYMFPRLFGAVRAGPMLAALRHVAAAFRPDLIVHEAGELAGPLVAGVLGIPNVTHGYGALVPAERVAAAAVEVAPLWEGEGLTAPAFAGCYRHLYLDIYPPSLSSGDRAHVPAVQLLRPVPFATTGDDPMPALVTAPSPDPLVYVTLGTVFNDDTGLFRTLVEGVAGLPVRVLATVGPAGDPAALGPQPANVEVVRYVAQTQLLEHVAAVVSHAGSGTFLAALGRGIPQLCIPQAADQFANAAAGTRCGAALTIATAEVTVERVRDAVTALLDEPGFRRAAAEVRADIDAMPGPDTVAGHLASLAGDHN